MAGSAWAPGTTTTVNSANTVVPENQVAVQGQTIVNLALFTYTPNTNSLLVFVNGVYQVSGTDYTESANNQITFASALTLGDRLTIVGLTAIIGTSQALASLLPFPGSIISSGFTAIPAAIGPGVTFEYGRIANTGSIKAYDYTAVAYKNLNVDGLVLNLNTLSLGATTVGGALNVTGAENVVGAFAVNTNKFNVAAASGNTLIAGTLGVVGATSLGAMLSSTVDGQFFDRQGASTGIQFMRLRNTSGDVSFGIEGSAGGALATGTSAYAVVVANNAATELHLATSGVSRLKIGSGGNITGTSTAASIFGLTINTSGANSTTAILQNTHATNPNGGVLELYLTATPNDTTHSFWTALDTNGTVLRAETRSNGGLANFSANNVNLSDERTKTPLRVIGRSQVQKYWDAHKAIEYGTFFYLDQTDALSNLGTTAQAMQKAGATWLIDESGWGEQQFEAIESGYFDAQFQPIMVERKRKISNPKLGIWETDHNYQTALIVQELQHRVEELQAQVASLLPH